MAILERFSSIIKSNVNALLDKCEDPAKMVDQCLLDLREDLAEVKRSTAEIMAKETRCKRLVDENQAAIKKYQDLAKKAIAAGNDNDAKTFLTKKMELEAKAAELQETYNLAKANADKMREMHNKLVSDIQSLESRKASIKAKMAVAKTQEKVNDIYESTTRASGTMDVFARMEDRAEQALDAAMAKASLNVEPVDSADELAEKYTTGAAPGAVDDELAKLKESMGL